MQRYVSITGLNMQFIRGNNGTRHWSCTSKSWFEVYPKVAFYTIALLFFLIACFPSTEKKSTSFFDSSVSDFCHTDPYISFSTYKRHHVSYANCYGDVSNNSFITFYKRAIEMPSRSNAVLARCHKNPFHSFYDCIWPLIHYVSTCVSRASRPQNMDITIVTTKYSLRPNRTRTWAEGALDSVLQSLRYFGINHLDTQRIPSSHAVCYEAVTTFSKEAKWRPLQLRALMGGDDMIPHTERSKAQSFQLFRRLALYSNPKRNFLPWSSNKRRVLVYSRTDANRRRWLNAFQFAVSLNNSLPNNFEVHYLWKMPKDFALQLHLHRDITALVAPHGASMANSLFMPQNSAVMEIASRNCAYDDPLIDSNDIGPQQQGLSNDISSLTRDWRNDSWTGWHSEKLGLHHISIPCTIIERRGNNFVTNNDLLLRTTNAIIQVIEHSIKNQMV